MNEDPDVPITQPLDESSSTAPVEGEVDDGPYNPDEWIAAAPDGAIPPDEHPPVQPALVQPVVTSNVEENRPAFTFTAPSLPAGVTDEEVNALAEQYQVEPNVIRMQFDIQRRIASSTVMATSYADSMLRQEYDEAPEYYRERLPFIQNVLHQFPESLRSTPEGPKTAIFMAACAANPGKSWKQIVEAEHRRFHPSGEQTPAEAPRAPVRPTQRPIAPTVSGGAVVQPPRQTQGRGSQSAATNYFGSKWGLSDRERRDMESEARELPRNVFQ